jgi:CubicO group peptidase (beta-lactamase class C family)
MRFPALLIFTASCVLAANDWDPREAEGFMDGVMEAQQKAHHFAGAVVVIVRDGEVVLEKGYGFSDFAARKPVDPKRTLFRVASNSKMFVWTSVMQLVEQGKLDLHTDVNRYLKGVQIPNTFPEPVTLENLMTHTAGFEDKVIGLFARDRDKMLPLADLMKRDVPRRIFPPGKVTAYSNYGTTLAALIVEQVSGMPYERYLDEHILKPLGMEHATLSQPLPAALAADISKGYRWSGGELEEQPFEYVPWAPCGGMSVSGEDMGRFMMAHLNDGALGATRILRADTAREMRVKLTSFSPKINGMLHGFMELNWNGEKVYGHGGDTLWFHSLTAMIPERRMGVFVAYNTDSGATARSEFPPVFFDHYFPSPIPKPDEIAKRDRSNLQRFAGTYEVSRASETDATKLMKLLNSVTIGVDSKGRLVTSGNETARWVQIEPLVFQEVDGKRQLVFRENEKGEIADACASPICVQILRKQPAWESRSVQIVSGVACLVVLTVAVIALPITAVLQRHEPKRAGSRMARAMAWLTSAAILTGLIISAQAMKNPTDIVFGVSPGMRTGFGIWTAGALLSLILAGYTFLAWRRSWWRLAGRISLTLVCVAALATAVWLNHWNLLSWRY